MTLRLLVVLTVLFAIDLQASDADGETVSFSLSSKVGSVVIPPGLYKLKLQGSLVFFMDVSTKRSVSTLVKVEKTGKKSSFTAAQARPLDGGGQQVDAIVLQGMDYKLVF